jgi:hypothetical protein
MVVERHHSPRETVYLQERHISQAFQEAIFEATKPDNRINLLNRILGAKTKAANPDDHVTIQNDLRTHLMKSGKPAFVEDAYVSFEEAKRLVLELGGIPSYPVLADGTMPMCEFEADADELIKELCRRSIHAVEWIPVRNSVEVVSRYVTKMRAAGLMATAGTEHNTLDLIPFEPACKDGPVPEEIRAIFWEGACVVAAHQFLGLHGRCGYVDTQGQPNPQYKSADERIRGLAKIGAAVIERYYEKCEAQKLKELAGA